jgi:hypothetical protein
MTKRTAKKKESICGECKNPIKIGDQYWDCNERIGTWKTLKYCIQCGQKLIKEYGTTGTSIGSISIS